MVRDVRNRWRTVAVGDRTQPGPRTREELEQWLGHVVVLNSDDATSQACGAVG